MNLFNSTFKVYSNSEHTCETIMSSLKHSRAFEFFNFRSMQKSFEKIQGKKAAAAKNSLDR